jgi:hypothetical protein
MNRIDFTNNGGFPLEQNTLGFMQLSFFLPLAAIAKLCGDKTILWGVENIAGNVTPGYISYGGELIFFQGGAYAAQIVITETPTQVTFEDDTLKEAYFIKTATVGVVGDFPFSDLTQLITLQDMWRSKDVKELDCDAAYIDANFDGTGLGFNERKGWAICNGNNGTKNRSGKVSVAYDAADADFNTLGFNAGEKKHTLTLGELPPHDHSNGVFNRLLQYSAGSGSTGGATDTTPGEPNIATYGTLQSVGANTPHNNLQPYLVTLFIQKL